MHHGLMTGSRESGESADPVRLAELLDALDAYRQARERLLHVLRMSMSNRDPLAEVREHLVLALVGGTMAVSRVQKGYDLTSQSCDRVQVRYLANVASVGWVNEHCVRSGDGFDLCALVLYESLKPTAVLVFPRDLTAISTALGKRHPGQDSTLQLTRRNYLFIRENAGRFRLLGMQVWLPPWDGVAAS